MRKKLVVANWKMNLLRGPAQTLTEALVRKVVPHDDVEIALCPSYLSLATVAAALDGSGISLGAQDIFWLDNGAFTGRVSAPMLLDVGVSICIVGHSETRGRFGKLEIPESTVCAFGDTDEVVNLKLKSIIHHGLTPILCVGETLSEREAGRTDSEIEAQLDGAFSGVSSSDFAKGIVAYEPVWAIGTGKTCDVAEASRVCGMIRHHLARVWDLPTSEATRILYGGSVKAANAKELFHAPDIDGGLVGGASLIAEEFAQVIAAALPA